MQRILVVKLADIGDVLTATPALRALRHTFPHAHITALVPPNSAGVLEGSALTDDLILFDKQSFESASGLLRPQAVGSLAGLGLQLRRAGFDAMLFLHHLTTVAGARKYAGLAAAAGAPVRAGLDNGRGGFLTHRVQDQGFGAFHEVEYSNQVVQLLGVEPDYGPLAFTLHDADVSQAEELLKGHTGKPRIAVHPGSGSYSLARRWPIERFTALAKGLVERLGATVIAVGGSEEQALGNAVAHGAGETALDLTGRTTLRELGAVLQSCDLLVCNDSGVMHLAAAVGTPVVALFGPSNHRAWGPWSPEAASTVLRSDLPCSPCFYTGHSLGTPEGCPERTCLQLITPEQVLDVVQRHLA